MKRLTGLAALAAAALAAGGARAEGGVGSRGAAIVKGRDAPGDVGVLQLTPTPSRIVCTGSVIAPNLVLTARHCVADVENIGFVCDPSKQDGGGVDVGSSVPPESLRFYLSEAFVTDDAIKVVPPDAIGKKIFASSTLGACANDVAVVMLDRDLDGVRRLPLRLDLSTQVGEAVYGVGWGNISTQGERPSVRQRRDDVSVLALGPARHELVPGLPAVPAIGGEVMVGQVGCNGDSGSPLRSQATGAIIGVLSYVVNVYPEKNRFTSAREPLPWCGDGAATIYHLLGGRDFLTQAFAESGHKPWVEGRPEPLAFGATCQGPDECDSGLCVAGLGASFCSARCDVTACTQGYSCVGLGGQQVCAPEGDSGAKDDGCGVAGRPAPWGEVLLAFAAIFAAKRRRRAGR